MRAAVPPPGRCRMRLAPSPAPTRRPRSPRRSRAGSLIGLLALALTALSPPASAQVGDPSSTQVEPEGDAALPSSTLFVLLKPRRIEFERARELVEEIATRSVRDRLRGAEIVVDQFERRQKAFDKLRGKVLDMVGKQAGEAQRDRLGRKGHAEVDELREQALAVSRTSGLTKQQIRDDIDPRVERLEQLLLPSFVDVLATEPKLDAALTELRVANAELHDWYSLYALCLEDLEGHEDLDRHLQRHPAPTAPPAAKALDDAIDAATFRGLEMPEVDRKALLHNEELESQTPHQEYLGTLRLNRMRYLLGLRLLRNDPKLSDAARDHSNDMRTLGFFSHTSPVDGKQRFGQRAANFGTSASAENIAAGQDTGHGAIRAWWYSPGHHRNMLGNHARTGLGQSGSTWTQMFGG